METDQINHAEVVLLDAILFEKQIVEGILRDEFEPDFIHHYEALVFELDSYFRELLERRARRRRVTDINNYNTGAYNSEELGYYPEHAPAA